MSANCYHNVGERVKNYLVVNLWLKDIIMLLKFYHLVNGTTGKTNVAKLRLWKVEYKFRGKWIVCMISFWTTSYNLLKKKRFVCNVCKQLKQWSRQNTALNTRELETDSWSAKCYFSEWRNRDYPVFFFFVPAGNLLITKDL